MIKEKLKNKTFQEKTRIKSKEIAKFDLSGTFDDQERGLRIEIVEGPNAITANGAEGVEVYIRAWKGDTQLGFGEDGTVDIERYRIFNPPIFAPDGTKTRKKVRKYVGEDKFEEKTMLVDNYTENVEKAIKMDVAHTVSLVGKEDNNIIPGKRGNTVSTFYPQPSGSETSSCDGWTRHSTGGAGTGVVWATFQSAAGSSAGDSAAEDAIVGIEADNVSDRWRIMYRTIRLFDTTAIATTDVASSVVYSDSTQAKTGSDVFGIAINVYESAPASDVALVAGDHDSFGSTDFATEISFAAIASAEGTYNDWTLNGDGLTYINAQIAAGDIARLGARESNFDSANVEPVWSSSGYSAVTFNNAEETGTTKDPKLVITHAAAPTTAPGLTLLGAG